MIQDPIFIVGTERSGSNLLRMILNSHSRIVVPHPPHIVRLFTALEPGYGDLSQEGRFAAFVDDVLALLRVHIYPWQVPIDRERLIREASPRDSLGVCVALYEQYREYAGKPRWACRSTFMIEFGSELMARFPGAKLLFLVRDPRDVAVSSRQSVFSTFHPYHTAFLWQRQQSLGLQLMDSLSPSSITLVRYEDLVADPTKEVKRICDFLGEPFEPEMLRYFETAEARKSSSLSESWVNTGKPIIKDNVKKFLRELRPEEVLWIEAVACETMIRLGYEPVHSRAELAATRFNPAQLARFWLEEKQLQVKAELRSLTHDKNVLRRWARTALLSYLYVRRGGG